MDIDVALDAHAVIGESPTWSAAEHMLYWIDIKRQALHRYDPRSGSCRTWPVSSDIGAFALMDGNAALVALRHGIHRLDLGTGSLDLLAPAPFDTALFRFNEGLCDVTGRFWVGVMFDPTTGSPRKQQASLHSFSLRGGLKRQNDEAELHNGMAWSIDGQRFFLSHSRAGTIYAFDFDPEQATLGSRTVFAQVPLALGVPDGAAIDVDGGYAVHGGGRLHRYTVDGHFDREVLLPVSQPTMCAFAGDDMDILYVTSASDGLNADQLRAEPLAGALLRLRPGVKGVGRPNIVR